MDSLLLSKSLNKSENDGVKLKFLNIIGVKDIMHLELIDKQSRRNCMDSWRGLEPKSVTIIVHRAEGLVSERKSEKGAKYMVTFGTGKKKQCQSEAVESPRGSPVFQSEAKVKISDVNDPVVLLVSDKKYHCGQVIIPVTEICALPEGTSNPYTVTSKRFTELEQTKKQSNPRGYLEYTCWVDELRLPGVVKEKGVGGLKSFLSRSNIRRSGSRPSISDMSVSTPHLLTANSSFVSSGAGKPKRSPLSRLKIRKRKNSRASSNADLDSLHSSGFGGNFQDDGMSSISGLSLEASLPPPVPPHGDPFANEELFKLPPVPPHHRGNPLIFTNEADNKGSNPFETYKGSNPFDEDTTDLDLVSDVAPSPVHHRRKIGPSVSRQGSSTQSEYSLDREEIVANAVKEERPVILSVSPMKATVEAGNVIHIEGRFMAKGANDVESVYLGDCELKGNNIQYVTSSKIKVFTRRWYVHRGPVYIKTFSNGNLYFDEDKEFVFHDPSRPDDKRNSSGRTSSFTSGYRTHSREPSTLSESESVYSGGKRYRKASRCQSNASRSMYHLASGLPEDPVQPKIKSNGTKSPGGSWSKGTSLASRFSKSFSDLTQNTLSIPVPLFHKKKPSIGSQIDLDEAFNDQRDASPDIKSRNNSTKKKASACAARIERKTDPPMNGFINTASSVSALEDENRKLQGEVDSLKRRISDLELSNQKLTSAKRERDDYIDRLQAKLLEANLFDFFIIDNSSKETKSLYSTT